MSGKWTIVSIVVLLAGLVNITAATTYTWTGSSGTNLSWCNAANWSPSTGYPDSEEDDAIIESTDPCCSIDCDVTCHSITVGGNTGYCCVLIHDNITVSITGNFNIGVGTSNDCVVVKSKVFCDLLIGGNLIVGNANFYDPGQTNVSGLLEIGAESGSTGYVSITDGGVINAHQFSMGTNGGTGTLEIKADNCTLIIDGDAVSQIEGYISSGWIKCVEEVCCNAPIVDYNNMYPGQTAVYCVPFNPLATNPSPADGSKCVDPNVILSWSPGHYAIKHDVYLGTNFNNVNNANRSNPLGVLVSQNQDANSYIPGGLAPCTTYYWRIDEVNEFHTPPLYKGNVWNFTTSGDECCKCIRPPSNMVAWWPLDENVPNIAEERVYGSNGTWMNGPTPTAGKVDGALSFDGSNDYVNVPNKTYLNFGYGNLSIDAWIQPSSVSGTRTILDKMTSAPIIRGYCFYVYNGNLAFKLGNGSGGAASYVSSLSVANGNWNHVAVTLIRNNPSGLKLYVNGVSETFNPTGKTGYTTNTINLVIGRYSSSSSNYFVGKIDEVELFNRALDASEIMAIYQAGSAGKCKCEKGETYSNDIKWSQPPSIDKVGCIYGWDEVSVIDGNCWGCPTQCHGDADCSGYVDQTDLNILVAAFGTHQGDPNYNPCADFDRDGDVDSSDQSILMTAWHTYPTANCSLARALVADDWICMDKRPVTNIHWWGSFKGWTESSPPADKPIAFRIGIWTDVPRSISNPNGFSHPGMLIWEKVCSCYTWSIAGCDIDPRDANAIPDTAFKFDQLLSQNEWFYQDPNGSHGTIYWLSIGAVYDGNTPVHPWGWKTRPRFYHDAAVRIKSINGNWPPAIGSTWESGEPIKYPASTPWDTSFVLTSNRQFAQVAGYWPQEDMVIEDANSNIVTIPAGQSDFNGDLVVNFNDFAVFAGQWLDEGFVWPEFEDP